MIKNIAENERESLGEFLRRTREEQGMSLEEVAEATKISVNSLKALEEDDYASLPADAFVRGFCGIYAEHLSLDAVMVRERYTLQQKNMPRRSTKRIPTPTQLALETSSMAERPSVTSHSIIGLSFMALFIIAATISWYFSWNPATYLSQKLRGASTESTVSTDPHDKREKPSDTASPEIHPQSNSPVTTAAAPTNDKSGPETPETEDLARENPVMAPPIVPIAAPPTTQDARTKNPSPDTTPSGQSGQTPATAKQVPALGTSTYLLKAIAKEAIQLSVKVDEAPTERLSLAAGEQRLWNAGKSIVISLPAGTGMTFTLNDIPLNLPKKDPGQEITVSIPEYLLE